ncbi:DNA-binding protein [Pseudomonas putida]
MARGGINLAVVRTAREALLARGVHPSIDAVRVQLGNTGSKSTIQRYLKELSAGERAQRPPTPDEELQGYVEDLSARLNALAAEHVAEDRRQLALERIAQEQQRLQQQAQLDQLQQAHATLLQELGALRAYERTLQAQLREADGERRRLVQVDRDLQQLLEERALRVQTLEDKLRQAREALAHYRQQHLTQRQEELQRHDTQTQQLQHELRELRLDLQHKLEELNSSSRDNERLVSELRAERQQAHRRDQDQAHLRQLHQDTDAALRLAQERLNTLSAANASLRERVKRHILKDRHVHRELRAQKQRVSELQNLLNEHPAAKPLEG